MNPILRYTQLAISLNSALDAGKSLPPDGVREHLQNQTLFLWLGAELGDPTFTSGLLKDVDKREVMAFFDDLRSVTNMRRKFGVERNGIAIVLAWCIEGIQQEADAAGFLHP